MSNVAVYTAFVSGDRNGAARIYVVADDFHRGVQICYGDLSIDPSKFRASSLPYGEMESRKQQRRDHGYKEFLLGQASLDDLEHYVKTLARWFQGKHRGLLAAGWEEVTGELKKSPYFRLAKVSESVHHVRDDFQLPKRIEGSLCYW